SMYPTIEIGDHIFVDKLSLYWRAPERGEVIVFEYPCTHDIDYVKRVIAVGGDTVEVRCNVVYVDGVAIPNELVVASDQYDDYDPEEHRWYTRATSRYRERIGSQTYEVFHDPDRPERDRHRDTLPAGDARDFPNMEKLIAPSCTQGEFYNRPTPSAGQLTGKIVVNVHDAKPCEQQAHFVVPDGGLFVMGDNRNNANDSRYWGVVSVDAVRGRVLGVWINDPPGGDRKWSRVGAIH
ncbi:MAG TPA: signal peptidase I, partial [Kofleriaceae bacterium]|nr:signal peptidase I [Kofleriaceae bacterium]